MNGKWLLKISNVYTPNVKTYTLLFSSALTCHFDPHFWNMYSSYTAVGAFEDIRIINFKFDVI